MRKAIVLLGTLLVSSSVFLTGCGDDDDDKKKGTGGTAGTGATGGGGTGGGAAGSGGQAGGGTGGTAGSGGGQAGAGGQGGALPTGQVDRIGRAAVSTALIPSANKDAYNQEPAATWAKYSTDIKTSLEAIDNLDGKKNNAIWGLDATILSVALANDQLIIDVDMDNCDGGYLAQEIAILTASAPAACGGRTLSQDVVDLTLQALVDFTPGATPPFTTKVTDAVDANDKAFTDAFPYLATPH